MRKTILAASLATAAVALPGLALAQAAAPAAAPTPAYTFTGNMGLFSEYRFRGIAQTFAKPALQGGFDFAHESGFYVGNWNSNISSGAGYPAGNLEMDFYGGWKKAWGDWGLDAGLYYYYYPGTDANLASGTSAAFTNPRTGQTHTGRVDNKEIYIGGSWKWLSAKYYYSYGDYFSLADTKGSNYLDVSANFDLGGGWGLNGHVGSFRLKNWQTTNLNDANYTDWKLGVTKDVGGWLLGATYIDTNAKGSCTAGEFYCFGNSSPAGAGTKFKDAGKGVVVLSISKTF